MKRHLTVLIVEHHPEVRDVLERMVESWFNVDLISCPSFLAAAMWIQHTPFIDLLIADICLPDAMTGIDVAEVAVMTFPEIAVVMISADPALEIPGLTERYSFVQKPFDREQLLEHIAVSHEGFKVRLRTQVQVARLIN